MKIPEYLVELVQEANSPASALTVLMKAIAEDLRSDACAIFLTKRKGRLSLRSSFGEALDEQAAIVAGRSVDRVLPATAEGTSSRLLSTPVVSRGAPIGALVVARSIEEPYSISEVTRLLGVASFLVDLLESARLAEIIDGTLHTFEDPPESLKESLSERILEGTAAAPGTAIGIAAFRQTLPADLLDRDGESRGPAIERDRARDAFQKARNDLLRLQSVAASETGEEHALIFASHLLLLGDPMLAQRVEQGVVSGQSATVAIDSALEHIVGKLRGVADPYIRERIEDLEDIRCRLLSHLLNLDTSESLQTQVVVSPRATPSLVLELKAQGAVGIASELGSTTSHGVLLARALGIPAVTGVTNLLEQVRTGNTLIIDGDTGKVILRPTLATLAEYQIQSETVERTRTEFWKYRDLPAQTADNLRFSLQANVALGVDLDLARTNGADGVGLYRTEFPFIARDGLPTIDEQVRIYSKAYAAFPDGPICFRVLDLAGDKFLPASDLRVSRNAFHGYRSIRVLFDYPHILRDQAQSFAIAAAGRPLKVLIPMVSSLEEFRRAKDLITDAIAQLPPEHASSPLCIGAMIEVPAAVEIMQDLATEVDFFSIGTNDLIQYSMVIDREDPHLSSARDAFHPALLRMVQRVIVAAHSANREVALCGEIAGRPELAIALLALGVDSLSVTPRVIPRLKRTLARLCVEPLRANIQELLRTSTAGAIEETLRQYVDAADPVE